jgi:hypothetical protein
MLPDGGAAYAAEAAIKSRGRGHGRPLLNPGKVTMTSSGELVDRAPS